jgi:hypothetical protein
MTLVWNWKTIITKAWSVRLWALAVLLSGLEVVLPTLDHFLAIEPGLFAILSAVAGIAGLLARLIPQPSMHDEDATSVGVTLEAQIEQAAKNGGRIVIDLEPTDAPAKK